METESPQGKKSMNKSFVFNTQSTSRSNPGETHYINIKYFIAKTRQNTTKINNKNKNNKTTTKVQQNHSEKKKEKKEEEEEEEKA